MPKPKKTPIRTLLNKPHAKRTLEQRVRCCEYAIKRLCNYNTRNAAALSAAWMNVPLS